MKELKEYIRRTLGFAIQPMNVQNQQMAKLPFYTKQAFVLYKTTLLGQDIVIAESKTDADMTIMQIEKQFNLIGAEFGNPVVLMARDVTAITRKRLIEKGINFIVPNKQMYLPALLLDLRETFTKTNKKEGKLLPSAQVILLYKILNRNVAFEKYTMKELAALLNYTPMAITKAVENLRHHKLCEVEGTKRRYIHFVKPIADLWNTALPNLVTPVLKRLYVDILPNILNLYAANVSALPVYGDMNDSKQRYYAIGKNAYYNLDKKEPLINANEHDGEYCLEIWKYDPKILTHNNNIVDPLSLYLTLRNGNDERIAMALDKIIGDVIW